MINTPIKYIVNKEYYHALSEVSTVRWGKHNFKKIMAFQRKFTDTFMQHNTNIELRTQNSEVYST